MISHAGIYAIINVSKCKMYIGSSLNVKQRLKQHKFDFKNNKSPKQIQSDYNNNDEFQYMLLHDLGVCCSYKQYYYKLAYMKSFKKSVLYNSFKGVIKSGWRWCWVYHNNREHILNNIKPMKITTESIAALCQALNCQPGDIMEYVDD